MPQLMFAHTPKRVENFGSNTHQLLPNLKSKPTQGTNLQLKSAEVLSERDDATTIWINAIPFDDAYASKAVQKKAQVKKGNKILHAVIPRTVQSTRIA